MADYKDINGVVYKESDIRGWARNRGVSFENYLDIKGLVFDKMDYDDAKLGDKLTDLGARTAYGFVSFAEGLSDYKDGLLYTLSTIGEDGESTPEAKEAAMIAIKQT